MRGGYTRAQSAKDQAPGPDLISRDMSQTCIYTSPYSSSGELKSLLPLPETGIVGPASPFQGSLRPQRLQPVHMPNYRKF